MSDFVNESEPLSELKTLITENWIVLPETPLPQILIVNDPEDAISKIDFRDVDYLLLSMNGNEQITMRGNWIYWDHLWPVLITIATVVDRQRLQNIKKMLRTILFVEKYLLPTWERIKLQSYAEMFGQGDINIWRGQLAIMLENYAVLAENTIGGI